MEDGNIFNNKRKLQEVIISFLLNCVITYTIQQETGQIVESYDLFLEFSMLLFFGDKEANTGQRSRFTILNIPSI